MLFACGVSATPGRVSEECRMLEIPYVVPVFNYSHINSTVSSFVVFQRSLNP
jgi:hypothetical protein